MKKSVIFIHSEKRQDFSTVQCENMHKIKLLSFSPMEKTLEVLKLRKKN